MKGSNTLTLNQATLIAAVQCYLDTQFAEGKSPKVTAVKASSSSYEQTFEVTIDDPSVVRIEMT